MKVLITCKNYELSEKLKETIDKKMAKLDKYFSDDITANVLVQKEGSTYKVESTIRTLGTIFRAEDRENDPYDCTDRVVEKLSRQMSKFKKKLQKKHKDNKHINFEALPEIPDEQEEMNVVKSKKFNLSPMSVDEAVLQMELLEHEFFVFLNSDTDKVCVVYKRNKKDYGMIEPVY